MNAAGRQVLQATDGHQLAAPISRQILAARKSMQRTVNRAIALPRIAISARLHRRHALL